jgi:hypothetical protein
LSGFSGDLVAELLWSDFAAGLSMLSLWQCEAVTRPAASWNRSHSKSGIQCLMPYMLIKEADG